MTVARYSVIALSFTVAVEVRCARPPGCRAAPGVAPPVVFGRDEVTRKRHDRVGCGGVPPVERDRSDVARPGRPVHQLVVIDSEGPRKHVHLRTEMALQGPGPLRIVKARGLQGCRMLSGRQPMRMRALELLT